MNIRKIGCWALLLSCASLGYTDEPSHSRGGLRDYALAHKGDPAHGKALFDNLKPVACRTCHKVRGEGGEVGPDLSVVAGKFDRPHLIESILEPGRQVVEGYRVSVVA